MNWISDEGFRRGASTSTHVIPIIGTRSKKKDQRIGIEKKTASEIGVSISLLYLVPSLEN
jgi:hypothetical protein